MTLSRYHFYPYFTDGETETHGSYVMYPTSQQLAGGSQDLNHVWD